MNCLIWKKLITCSRKKNKKGWKSKTAWFVNKSSVLEGAMCHFHVCWKEGACSLQSVSSASTCGSSSICDVSTADWIIPLDVGSTSQKYGLSWNACQSHVLGRLVLTSIHLFPSHGFVLFNWNIRAVWILSITSLVSPTTQSNSSGTTINRAQKQTD